MWKQDEYEDIITDCSEIVMSFSTGFLGSKKERPMNSAKHLE